MGMMDENAMKSLASAGFQTLSIYSNTPTTVDIIKFEENMVKWSIVGKNSIFKEIAANKIINTYLFLIFPDFISSYEIMPPNISIIANEIVSKMSIVTNFIILINI